MPNGFTLIELILVIMLTAIVGSFLIAYMGTAVTRSADPVNQTRNLAIAEETMEKITAAYAAHLSVGTSVSWNAFKGNFTPTCIYPNTSPSYPTLSSQFETIEATVSVGDHKLVSYFMQ